MRKFRKYIKLIVSLVFVLAVGITAIVTGVFKSEPLPEGMMYVDFIDVGQGDCTLIRADETVILVDAGEVGEADKVISFLKETGVEEIDCCIATHPHADHIGGMPQVIEEFEVLTVLTPDIPENLEPTNKTYENFLDSLNNVERFECAEAGNIYEFGEICIEILGPVKDYEDLNHMSLVAKISFGETSVMITGDTETPAENDMLERNNVDYTADILNIGHHGSKTSTSDEWLAAVDPDFAVISCGIDNGYGHPHKEVINKLVNSGVTYYRTDLVGNISFESDGKSFKYIDNNDK